MTPSGKTTPRAVSSRQKISVPPQQLRRVKDYLETTGGSLSGLFVLAMNEYLERKGK